MDGRRTLVIPSSMVFIHVVMLVLGWVSYSLYSGCGGLETFIFVDAIYATIIVGLITLLYCLLPLEYYAYHVYLNILIVLFNVAVGIWGAVELSKNSCSGVEFGIAITLDIFNFLIGFGLIGFIWL